MDCHKSFQDILKDLDVKYTNTIMSFTGFVILIILSSVFEGNTIQTIKNISLEKLVYSFVCWSNYFLTWTFNDVLFV